MRPSLIIATLVGAAIAATTPATALAGSTPALALAGSTPATALAGSTPATALARSVPTGARHFPVSSPASAVPAPTVTAATTSGSASVHSHGLVCSVLGIVSTLGGIVCKVATHPGEILHGGKELLSGHISGAVNAVLGSGVAKTAAAAAGLAAVVAWVSGGAEAALHATAGLISSSTEPQVGSGWFKQAYLDVGAVSTLLTLPFLCAAAMQALLRSDPAMLARAAFGYLPLGMLAVGVGIPLTIALLKASDEMSAIVASAAGDSGGSFLEHVGLAAGGIAAVNPFVVFFVALLTVAGTITLWLELLIREASVYVIVLMLPLFFAALVWPARRVWAIRAVEVLVALILSKFAIVAVLALGGLALHNGGILDPSSLLAGLTLVLLASFSPWALLRLLPMHEMASAAAGGLRTSAQPIAESFDRAAQLAARNVRPPDGVGEGDPAHDHQPALTPGQGAARTEGTPDADVETAAEQAATAVAASGGAAVSTADPPPGAGASPAQTPPSQAPPLQVSPGAASASASAAQAPQPPSDASVASTHRHLSAPGADTLPERWHRDWGPIPLSDEIGREPPVGEPPAIPSDDPSPPAVDPPSPPDADPLPPGLGPDGDRR